MSHEIVMHVQAVAELELQRVFDQRKIMDSIKRSLRDQPAVAARNRKCVESLAPSFEHVPPLWELRVGHFRVFYDVDEAQKRVNIRAIRRKLPGQTTESIT